MLTELSIENFAIIDLLHVRFGPGFTVLTGETGAGKSIIIDALQAALGARTGADAVRSGARMASVEAIFDLSDTPAENALAALLEEHGIELEDSLILRREINSSGRGSARLNGRAVPLTVLAAAGNLLVDIHGQSDHLSVLRRERQLEAIDSFGDLLELRAGVGEAVRRWSQLNRELAELEASSRETEQRLDLLRFQVAEIEASRLTPGEEEELLVERNLLANGARLAQLADAGYELLHGERDSALSAVLGALSATRELAAIDPALVSLDERLQATRYELEDLGAELRRYRDGAEHDPHRLDEVEERLDLFTRLRRKYGATIEEVIAFGETARESLEAVEHAGERMEGLRVQAEEALAEATERATALSRSRVEAARRLTVAMREALEGLGLRGTAFEASVSQLVSQPEVERDETAGRRPLSQTGFDAAAFLVSFNQDEPLRPLERVASGGETSRFLLALKSVLAAADRTPTLVFDEVDVGIGARHGMIVGERLHRLARSHQVLSITHLPQIAAMADEHLRIEKGLFAERTGVTVRQVENAERVVEIAEMMTGTNSETALVTAAELLAEAQTRA